MLIRAEIVYATEDRQELIEVQVEQGTTVGAAIDNSPLVKLFPDEPLDVCPTGIWGRRVERTRVLRHGDRVELYRALEKNPREARRDRAIAAQK